MSDDKINKIIARINEVSEHLPEPCKVFLNQLKVENKSVNTILNYAHDLKAWVNYQFVNVDIKEITNEMFETISIDDMYKYISQLQENEKASSSVARAAGTIKSFYKTMKKLHKFNVDVAKDLTMPKIEKKLPKYLTEKESIRLLNSVDRVGSKTPERDYAVLTVFLNTGIRLSELIDINLSDIHGDILLVNGKGSKEREIPLSESCLDSIKEYLKVRQSDDKALFVNRFGDRFETTGMQDLVNKYLKAIGKSNLSVHKMRHTALSNMIRNGADIRTVQEVAGHENINTTTIYTHIDNETKRKAVNNTGLSKIKRQSK
jgi:site-specific recombinase XerD